MKRNNPTRFATDVRHYNDQNPGNADMYFLMRIARSVRPVAETGQIRSIIIAPPRMKAAQEAHTANGVPLPNRQVRKFE